MNTALKVAIGVLAGIGAIAVVGAAAMAFMHASMMGGFGC